MDKDSCTVYRKMGFTHFVDIPNPDPRLPGGYKAVKESDKAGVWHDENGVEYHAAKPLPF